MTTINLPDFDDFISLTHKIRDLTLHGEVLKNQIEEKESNLHHRYMTDPELFYNGKPLSSVAIKSAYEFGGFNNELIPLRNQLAQVQADLEQAKLQFDVYKMMVDVYRTEAANKRFSV